MSTSFESLAVLLVLLPGFLASLVYSALQERREASSFREFMEALAFAFGLQLVLAVLGAPPPLTPSREASLDAVRVEPLSLGLSAVLALGMPCLLSLSIERDWLLRIVRRVGMTTRTGRASVWLDVLSLDAHVMLHFRDGVKVIGWPALYSDSVEEGMIYLQDPSWVKEDGSREAMNVEGLFACNASELKFLTVVRDRSTT